MLVGALQVNLFISHANSLKEKRRVLKSVKDNLRNRFNVAVAEVDRKDTWQVAVLGIVSVSGEKRFLEETLSKVVDYLKIFRDCHVADYSMEIF